MREKQKALIFRLNPQLRLKLGQIAKEEDISMSQLVRTSVIRYIKSYERRYERSNQKS